MKQDIRKTIDLLLRSNDKSISELSEEIDLSRQTIYRFLSGESDMRFSYIVALLKELGVDLNEIVARKVSDRMGVKKEVQHLELDHILSKLNRREQVRVLGVLISEIKDKPAVEEELRLLKDYRKKVRSIRGRYGTRKT